MQNLTNSQETEPVYWPLGAGAEKCQEPKQEPELIGKKNQEPEPFEKKMPKPEPIKNQEPVPLKD